MNEYHGDEHELETDYRALLEQRKEYRTDRFEAEQQLDDNE